MHLPTKLPSGIVGGELASEPSSGVNETTDLHDLTPKAERARAAGEMT